MHDLRCTSAYRSHPSADPLAVHMAVHRVSIITACWPPSRAGRCRGSSRIYYSILTRERYTRDACIKRARILLFAMAATANPGFTPLS